MRAFEYGTLIQLRRLFVMNCYLVREDDGFTLIDTLISGSAGDILAAAEARGAPIRRIVLTHAHADHIGSLDALHARLPGAEVVVPEREVLLMRRDLTLRPDEPQIALKGGFPGCKTEPTRTVAEGDMVGWLRVVTAPGHTPGHIALFDTRDATLIAGDAFVVAGGLSVAGKPSLLFPLPSWATWHRPTALESARKLRALNPSKLAVGHGKVLHDPLPAIDRAIAAAERAFSAGQGAR